MEYYGGARQPSAWNNYVKANYGTVAHLPAKQRLGALAEQARAEGVIGHAQAKPRSACAGVAQAGCLAPCKWVVPEKPRKSGKPRSSFCKAVRAKKL